MAMVKTMFVIVDLMATTPRSPTKMKNGAAATIALLLNMIKMVML